MNAQALSFFSLIFISSFFLVLSSNDWFLIWLGLEVNMLSFMLIIFGKSSMETESCLKYFFIQSLGSAILMMSFYSQSQFMGDINIVVLSYKMGGGPFFFWFPSLCEGISWVSCFFLMSIQKVMPFMLMSFYSLKMLLLLGMLSLFIGVMGSFNQSKLKRLMAYSSIHHLGWLMLCIILSNPLWLMYLTMYTFMILGVFFTFKKDYLLTSNLLNSNSGKWVLIMGMMSMGGIPPMLGFFLKWLIFYKMNFLLSYFYVFMILMSVVMVYIYLRIVYTLVLGGGAYMSLETSYYEIYYSLKDSFYLLGLVGGSFLGVSMII